MNSVFNPTKKLLEKSNNAKINFLRKNITETPPLITNFIILSYYKIQLTSKFIESRFNKHIHELLVFQSHIWLNIFNQ